jgi:hypothetical protein
MILNQIREKTVSNRREVPENLVQTHNVGENADLVPGLVYRTDIRSGMEGQHSHFECPLVSAVGEPTRRR